VAKLGWTARFLIEGAVDTLASTLFDIIRGQGNGALGRNLLSSFGGSIVGEAFGAIARRAARSIDNNIGRVLRAATCAVNSFSADTTVATADGDVPISDIEVGDEVLAYHEEQGEVGEYEVIDTISHVDQLVVHVVINGEVIETTAEHPFYTDQEIWVNAADLEPGDQVYSLGGEYGTVESVAVVEAPQPMYNLTVDDAHTFAVGDGAWVVHNTGLSFCVEKNYGDSLKSQAAQLLRLAIPSLRDTTGTNVAVFQFADEVSNSVLERIDQHSRYYVARTYDNMLAIRNLTNLIHAERVGDELITGAGVSRTQVVDFYSEYNPCTSESGRGHNCLQLLAGGYSHLGNNASYTFRYPNERILRDTAVEELLRRGVAGPIPVVRR
jgi:hypothetical protein